MDHKIKISSTLQDFKFTFLWYLIDVIIQKGEQKCFIDKCITTSSSETKETTRFRKQVLGTGKFSPVLQSATQLFRQPEVDSTT